MCAVSSMSVYEKREPTLSVNALLLWVKVMCGL